MARYIDVDKARKHLRVDCLAKYPTTCIDGLLAAAEELTRIPTADVAEVVRCRICKHRRETMHGSYCLPAFGLKQITDLDAFCSYGERRNGNEV